MLTDAQRAAIARFTRLGDLWQRGRPRRPAPTTITPPTDPYADLSAVYDEETERQDLDLGVPIDAPARPAKGISGGGTSNSEDLPGVGSWFGFHVEGDHRYE